MEQGKPLPKKPMKCFPASLRGILRDIASTLSSLEERDDHVDAISPRKKKGRGTEFMPGGRL